MLKHCGWKERDLAEALGVHHVTVCKWIRGTHRIDQRTEIAIRAALGLSSSQAGSSGAP